MAINTDQVLVSHSEIEEMLDRLSAELNRDYGDEPLVVVGILTGAFIFTADLVRRLEMPVIVDFMQVSSYVGEFSTGELKIKKDMSSRLHARRQMEAYLYDVTEVPTEAAGKKKNTKTVDVAQKLFDEIAPKYADRKGGYTRIVKIGERKGDAAMEVLLELV